MDALAPRPLCVKDLWKSVNPAVIPTVVCIKPDLTLLLTKVWIIKNRLFLVGALAPRPMCAKLYENCQCILKKMWF